MTRTKPFLLGPGLLVLACAAHGQTEPAVTDGEAASRIPLEEIVVTARRRSESLQDVPQVVNAVNTETIEKLNITRFEEIASVVPGLVLDYNRDTNGLNSTASVRGVSFDVFAQSSPTVEFYLNDALIEPAVLFQAIYDVGQVEVLRGPQGTLRGRSAPSGAITFTTRRPDLSEVGGYASSIITHSGDQNFQGAFNTPLIPDKLAVRVAALYDDNDGSEIESVTSSAKTSDKTRGARVTLRFEPTEAISATLMYQYNEHNYEDVGLRLFGPGAPEHPTHPANYNGPALSIDDNATVREGVTRTESTNDVFIAQLDWRFAGQKLSYVGGHTKIKTLGGADGKTDSDTVNAIPNAQIGSITHSRNKQISNEMRLSSEERIAGFLDYTVGAFFFRVRGPSGLFSPTLYNAGAFGSPLDIPNPTTFDPRYVSFLDLQQRRKDDERSVFANVTFHLTDATELSLGGRRIVLKTDSIAIQAFEPALIALAMPPDGCPASSVGSTYPGTCDIRFALPATTTGQPTKKKPWVYNASLSHRFTEDFMAYANTGTSWRRGPGPVLGNPQCADPVYCSQWAFLDPEKSRSIEVGFKSSLLDKRVLLNLAVYDQKFDGLITRISSIPYLGTRGVQSSGNFVVNADTDVRGIDIDTSFRVSNRWSVGAAFSYAKSRFDDAVVPCRDSNFDGIPDNGPLPSTPAEWQQAGGPAGPTLCVSDESALRAPKWNLALQTEYTFPLFDNANAFVRGLFNYYPKNKNAPEAKNFTVDNYGILNAYVGLRSAKGTWEVSAFAKNAFDDDTVLFISDEQATTGSIMGLAGSTFGRSGYHSYGRVAGREVGLSVRYAFGSH